MIRKLTMPTFLCAVALKKADEPGDFADKANTEMEDLGHYKCKLSDLPIYAPLHSFNKPQLNNHPERKTIVQSSLEDGIRFVREEVHSVYDFVATKAEVIDNYYETAKLHTMSTIDYLNEPQNIIPRSGAIAIGGLSGFIFAARGGFIKKVFYTTFGAGAIASLCYPRQAEQFARDALLEARKGYAITYNFVKGVKPGDQISIEPINKFPSSLQDVKFLFWDLYDEAKEAIFPEKK